MLTIQQWSDPHDIPSIGLEAMKNNALMPHLEEILSGQMNTLAFNIIR